LLARAGLSPFALSRASPSRRALGGRIDTTALLAFDFRMITVVFNAVFGKRTSLSLFFSREREREEEEGIFTQKQKGGSKGLLFSWGILARVAKNSTHYSQKRSLLLF
jgi:hypothetical protein